MLNACPDVVTQSHAEPTWHRADESFGVLLSRFKLASRQVAKYAIPYIDA
jgi:hypothetical protein